MPCPKHARKDRPSSSSRGYDHNHEREHAEWQRRMDKGEVVHCRRGLKCLRYPNTRIDPAKPWHLGHPDKECPEPKGPEHMRCNTSAPGRLR